MICPWCQTGEDDGSGSHGICDGCATQMAEQSAQRQFDKVPSYVEVQAALFAQECDQLLSELEVAA